MRKIFLFLLLSLVFTAGNAQSNFLSGIVCDAKTGEVLLFANIINLTTLKGNISNSFGAFQVPLSTSKPNQVRFSYTGYSDTTITIYPEKVGFTKVYLNPGVDLEGVTVSASNDTRLVSKANEADKINIKTSKQLPSNFGETDIVKTLQLLPGVVPSSESKSNLIVRGGSTDQNLVLVDDVPLYSIGHFADIISVFNEDAISHVNFYKNSFPARLGGRLSSILDIRTRDGNSKEYAGGFSVGLLSTKATIEGPIVKDKSSFILSGRKSYVGYIMSLMDLNTNYGFYDVNLKINSKIKERGRIYLNLYSGLDNIGYKFDGADANTNTTNDLSWGNSLASLRYTHHLSENVFGSFGVYFTKYSYINQFEEVSRDVNQTHSLFSGIDDYGININFQHTITSYVTLYYGSQNNLRYFTPTKIKLEKTKQGVAEPNYTSTENETNIVNSNYFDLVWKPNSKFQTSVGLRTCNFIYSKEAKIYPEPKISVQWDALNNISFTAGYMWNTQFLHSLSTNNNSFQSDILMPSTLATLPPKAIQYSLGIDIDILEENYNVSLSGYYKDMSNLIQIKPGGNLFTNANGWEEEIIRNGSGQAYGLEFILSKPIGKFSGFISGTLSKSLRSFAEIKGGESFPYQYDRLFCFSSSGIYKINNNFSLSAVWNFYTGLPLMLPVQKYQLNSGETIFYYNTSNQKRAKAYHRLDFGANYEKKYQKFTLTYSFGLINAYNKLNPSFYLYEYNYEELGGYKLHGFVLFPILPYFNINLRI
jgi:hypothetical protein